MVFAYDTEAALVAAVALVNSAEPPVTMTTTEELAAFFAQHNYTGKLDGGQAELDAVHGILPRLRELLTSTRDETVDQVNEILAEAKALPRLVRHGDTDWHLHLVEDDRPLHVRILVETAMAMVDVIRADELSRLDICADGDCEALVLDLSRNRSRRFCSTTCGNRAAVAAYRARQAN
ncbi:CGNR zinc finger domain-containing protein [Aeromicrobium ginsengisoli]|uniref:CGNR zinc finger domain-containing protein n=1 Tax=Aeromicrobium ginsengisoli TaxID=363867 RepID=A0A5M4FAH4_9ACTN|nr:CGNR zinc finger domain-containing protein [Aeromicrobium ginsengisoli]KAA1395358.1 CGNR zinc finger domain-containing protein [Aeromicrobium ginsengisoli]